MTVLERSKNGAGRVAALRARNGRVIWQHDLASRAESSPLVDGGRVYFGSEDGTLYALSARTGKTIWTYRASGAVKGSPSLSKGVLFFGDYGGQVHAVYARSGRRKWSTGTNGSAFGRSGQFYSTAAVIFGRVYLGNTDGRVYSFVERTGQLAWATRTGNYVYASPAVTNVRGPGPHRLRRVLRRQLLRVQRPDGRRALAVLGRRQDLGVRDDRRRHRLLRRPRPPAHRSGSTPATGKQGLELPHGGFDPVISDGKRLYVTGYSSLFALVPKGAAKARSKPKPR